MVAAIQKNTGIPWKSDTVDTFKAGNPDSQVTGIAVTMMATLDVLRGQQQSMKICLIIMGHVPSEQPGMDNCARWLRTFLKGIQVEFVPTPEPFWIPDGMK
ncbi:MAG: hypothetical protein JO159_20080 [Acidobacteria bacterium]|nr:hypothetical protein [Acidobacteriota bacterium]